MFWNALWFKRNEQLKKRRFSRVRVVQPNESSRDPMLGPRGIAKTHATNQPGQDPTDPTDPTADLVELSPLPCVGSVPGDESGGRRFESFRARQLRHCHHERILKLRSPHLIWARKKIRGIGGDRDGRQHDKKVLDLFLPPTRLQIIEHHNNQPDTSAVFWWADTN